MADPMSNTKCYTCGSITSAHRIDCPNHVKNAPPKEREVLGEDNFGVLDLVRSRPIDYVSAYPKEIVADKAPTKERTWQDILAEGAGKPTPEQALALWQAMHAKRKAEKEKIERVFLPVGGYVGNTLNWTMLAVGHSIALQAYPETIFRADAFFVETDLPGIIIADMHFGCQSVMIGRGGIPASAFPVAEFEPCPGCGAKCRSTRITDLVFPAMTPGQRITVFFENSSQYAVRFKAWFEGASQQAWSPSHGDGAATLP